jgi:hypothetical protein
MDQKAKTYKGNPPHGEKWTLVQTLKDGEQGWQVWRKEQQHSDQWATFKVCAIGRAARKANYWVVLNELTGQLGFAKDYAVMRANKPTLHRMVEQVFEGLKHGRLFEGRAV